MSRLTPENEYEALVYMAGRLALRFPWTGEDEILAMAAEELQAYSSAHMRSYVPLLVERDVVRRLRAESTAA